MTDPIKITMMGASGVGKTCFMLSMYAVMRNGVRGFTFATEDLDDDLELDTAWLRLSAPRDRKWPVGTDKLKNYLFKFGYGFSKIMTFEWLDYRGGAVSDRQTAEDVQSLMGHISASSCLLICVTVEDLVPALNGGPIGNISKTGRLNQLLNEFYSTTGRPVPVVIVLTKWDLCPPGKKQQVIQILREQVFSALFVDGYGWQVMICPVTLGLNIGKQPQNAAIAPVSVHLPVVFAIFCALKARADQLGAEVRQKRGEILAWEQGWIRRILHPDSQPGSPSPLEQQADMIDRQIKLLSKELIHDPVIFFNGKEIEIAV